MNEMQHGLISVSHLSQREGCRIKRQPCHVLRTRVSDIAMRAQPVRSLTPSTAGKHPMC